MTSRDRIAFTGAAQGDLRNDAEARKRLSRELGIAEEWAAVRQIHGSVVHRASQPGTVGEGDAIWTDRSDLPLAVFTADCLGVAVLADGAVGVAHAGWRGAAAGVVPALASAMTSAGHSPRKVVIGPGIGPCCFEVGPEVLDLFPGHVGETTWGTPSVDLAGVVASQMDGMAVELVAGCTRHDEGFFSHRRDGTKSRQVALVWRP